MQDAYASEANAIGGWKEVGYVAPGAAKAGIAGGTTNFSYTSALLTGTTAISGGNVQGWSATNNVALNDCSANSGTWTIQVEDSGTGNSLKYTATPGCDGVLTPSFDKIGK